MNQGKTLKETADEVVSDIHKFEHEEKMTMCRLIHNGLLIFFIFLFVAFVSIWFVFLFLLWEHKEKKEKSPEPIYYPDPNYTKE